MTLEISPECMLCKQNAEVDTINKPKDVHCFKDCNCGKYYVDRCDYEDFLALPAGISDKDRSRMSALIKENKIKGNDPLFLQFRSSGYIPVRESIPIGKEELLHGWPRSTPERINRTICNLGRMSTEAGKECPRLADNPATTFARSGKEAAIHETYLIKKGYVAKVLGCDEITLTLDGWCKYEELTIGASSADNPVFVAMWFGGKSKQSVMTDLYTKTIEPAIKRAGYQAKKANSDEYNDFIMDEVLGSIRMAPFVIADFTGNRNGVYLEAGFARGLGLPVIHTCNKDHFDDTHFDIKQINTIQWNDPGDFKKKLFNRILATVGPGPEFRAES